MVINKKQVLTLISIFLIVLSIILIVFAGASSNAFKYVFFASPNSENSGFYQLSNSSFPESAVASNTIASGVLDNDVCWNEPEGIFMTQNLTNLNNVRIDVNGTWNMSMQFDCSTALATANVDWFLFKQNGTGNFSLSPVVSSVGDLCGTTNVVAVNQSDVLASSNSSLRKGERIFIKTCIHNTGVASADINYDFNISSTSYVYIPQNPQYEDIFLSSCGNINSAGIYTLNSNVNSSGTCFNINSASVTLNCAGYFINYSTASTLGYGVNNSGFNDFKLQNCRIYEGNATTNNKHATYIKSSTNSTLYNNTIYTEGSGSYGIYLNNSLKINATSNFIRTINGMANAIYGLNTNQSNFFENNLTTFGTQSNGFATDGGNNNTLYLNNITISGTNAHGVNLQLEPSYYNNVTKNVIKTFGSSSSRGINTNPVNNSVFNYNNITTVDGTGLYPAFGSSNEFYYNSINMTSTSTDDALFTSASEIGDKIIGNNFYSTASSNTGINIASGFRNNISYNNMNIVGTVTTMNDADDYASFNIFTGTGGGVNLNGARTLFESNIISVSGNGITITNSNSNIININNITSSGGIGISIIGTSKNNLFLNNNITSPTNYEIKDATTLVIVNTLKYNTSLVDLNLVDTSAKNLSANLSIDTKNSKGLGLGINILLSNNSAFLNASDISTGLLNQTANITFYTVSYASNNDFTIKLSDSSTCPSGICTKINFNPVMFTVSGFDFKYNTSYGINQLPILINLFANQTSIVQNQYINFTSLIIQGDNSLSSFIFSYDNGTNTFYNSTARLISSSPANISIIQQITAQAGATVNWLFYANDSFNNWNVSATKTFTTIDNIPPTSRDAKKNQTTIYNNQYIFFEANWTDNIKLSSYIFSIDNGTGTYENQSSKLFYTGGINNVSNATFQITAPSGATVNWVFYANDSINNWNVTSTQTFIVSSSTSTESETANTGIVGSSGSGSNSYSGSKTEFIISLEGIGGLPTVLEINNGVIKSIKIIPIKDVKGSIATNIKEKPENIPQASLRDYNYVQIEVGKELNENLKELYIEFIVKKSWISDKNINKDKISMFEFKDGNWVELETTKTGEDAENFIYTSKTTKFSLFAIGGKEFNKESKEKINEDIKKLPDENIIIDKIKSNFKTINLFEILGIIFLIGFLNFIVIVFERKRRK